MKVTLLKIKGNWRDVADAARTTINMEPGTGEPSSSWKRRMLLAEHSPIRKLIICAKFEGIPMFVSDHIARHKVGIEHFISTQRDDRTGGNRCEKSQCELRTHEIEANAQAIIQISRKRLCAQASPETREAWKAFLTQLRKVEPELEAVCVPECVYRGFCPEMNCCGFVRSKNHKTARKFYELNAERARG